MKKVFLAVVCTVSVASLVIGQPISGGTGGGGGIAGGSAYSITTIEIGDWNMQASASVEVNHGISDIMKIRGVWWTIRDDVGSNFLTAFPSWHNDLSTVPVSLGLVDIDDSTVELEHHGAGSFWDADFFNATSYNRGWITFLIAD